MVWTTENAFYYSYYKDVREAPNLGSAMEGLLHNNATEAPDTINIRHRFNVLQEVSSRSYPALRWSRPRRVNSETLTALTCGLARYPLREAQLISCRRSS